MAYKLYMAGTLMPITPSKVTVKINNQNKTMTLIKQDPVPIHPEPAEARWRDVPLHQFDRWS